MIYPLAIMSYSLHFYNIHIFYSIYIFKQKLIDELAVRASFHGAMVMMIGKSLLINKKKRNCLNIKHRCLNQEMVLMYFKSR